MTLYVIYDVLYRLYYIWYIIYYLLYIMLYMLYLYIYISIFILYYFRYLLFLIYILFFYIQSYWSCLRYLSCCPNLKITNKKEKTRGKKGKIKRKKKCFQIWQNEKDTGIVCSADCDVAIGFPAQWWKPGGSWAQQAWLCHVF